jgi:hypothetical protein
VQCRPQRIRRPLPHVDVGRALRALSDRLGPFFDDGSKGLEGLAGNNRLEQGELVDGGPG